MGYVFFYNFLYYYHHPFSIFYIWEGGMSFHGGLIGVLLSIFFVSKKTKTKYVELTDTIALIVPLILGLGRIGNFINGEIWGKVATNTIFSVIFPRAIVDDLHTSENNENLLNLLKTYNGLPRYPVQLYEFFLEGFVLFFILFFFKRKSIGILSSLFLILYSIFRIITECMKDPDTHIKIFNYSITTGQILSFPMLFFGLILFLYFQFKTPSYK